MSTKGMKQGNKGIRGVVIEWEGVAVDVRVPMANALKKALKSDFSDALTHGFLCRHLVFSAPARVAFSVAEDLGLRSSARDALEKGLAEARDKALGSGRDGLRPGVVSFLRQAADHKVDLKVVARLETEAWENYVSGWGLESMKIGFLPWEVDRDKAFPEGWARVAGELEYPASACVAVVGSDAACYSALSAGFRSIGVPDRYTRHHGFSGSDGVFETPEEIDLKEATGIGVP